MAEKKTTAKTAPAPAVETVENPVNKMIDGLVEKAQAALKEFLTLDQEQIDHIVHEMALAGLDKHQELARMAVEETGRGVYEDKVIKNMFATEYIWHDIKKEKTVGVLDENEMEGYVEVAEPVGVIAGVTPTTNPTSTTLFKSLIAVKTRNPIIFGFHPSAQKCSAEAARIVYEAAVKAGAPENCIQWIDTPSIEATGALMNHPGVATILATGGPGMVKAAYSCGKPALGVGPGNVPCYIEKSADLHRACTDLMMSKTFDNGMICASEQAVIVDKEIAKAFEDYMKANNCYFLNKEETEKLTKFMFPDPSKGVYGPLVGKSANWIAEQAGLKVPEKTKILIAPISSPDENHPLAKEKLSPVLAYFVVNSKQQGFDYANKMLELGGLGHSAVIHTGDMKIADEYGVAMRVGRIIVNSPSSQGAIGDIYNTNTPSLTLGCGSYGKNSVSQNVTTVNLINKKRIAKRRVNMQWFKVPPRIYFEEDSIQYLEKMEGISRAFIVTDPMMVKLGNVDKVLYYLRKREEYCHSEIYSDVESDPSVECIMRGVKAMNAFQPDVIIAIGGGSAIDTAKAVSIVIANGGRVEDYEGADLSARPGLPIVAVNTTAGTGSEVTSFYIVTNPATHSKMCIMDTNCMVSIAVNDVDFMITMPPGLTASTGMDAMTHAIEAYVSTLHTVFTDPLALKAIHIVEKDLLRSFNGDMGCREEMHYGQCLAGMAFSNALLGIVHSMAHKTGAAFSTGHITHGLANAMYLPYVIAYNAKADGVAERYADIARTMGVVGDTTAELVEGLRAKIRSMNDAMGIPNTLKDFGIIEDEFKEKLDAIAANAVGDACTGSNPRPIDPATMAKLFTCIYYGTEVDF